MGRKISVHGLVMPLMCALIVLGAIWGITEVTYQEPTESGIAEKLEDPPLKFEGKYTVDAVAAKIEVTGISQATNSTDAREDTSVSLSINGVLVDFGESGPIMSQGSIMVPIKEVLEHLGFEIAWNGENRSVTATDNENKIVFTVGQMLYLFNDEPTMLDTPAQIIDDKTMVPLRAILDCIGAEFEWLESDKLVKLTMPLNQD